MICSLASTSSSERPSVGRNSARATTRPSTSGARRGSGEMARRRAEHAARAPAPPHHDGGDDEQEIADRRQQAEQLVEPAEQLPLMRGDADHEDLVDHRRGGEALLLHESRMLRRIELDGAAQHAILRRRPDDPVRAVGRGRRDGHRIGEAERGGDRRDAIEAVPGAAASGGAPPYGRDGRRAGPRSRAGAACAKSSLRCACLSSGPVVQS